MEKYKFRVELDIEVEAPSLDDAEDMIQDHYGVGSGGEGVEVVTVEWHD